MAAEEIAGVSVQLALHVEAWKKELDRAHNEAKRWEKGVQSAFDRINGTKAQRQVEMLEAAFKRFAAQGLKPTADQVSILRNEIERLARAGAKLPASLAGLRQGQGGVLAGNIQQQGLASLQGQLGPLGGLMAGLSGTSLAAAAGIGALAAAAAAAGVATAAAVVQFADFSSGLQNLSIVTGIGTTALQELEFAGSFSKLPLEEITASIGRMQKAITAGSPAIKGLGLDLEELRELSPEEQFYAVAQAVSSIPDPTQRAATAMAIFKNAGLLPLLGDLPRLRDEFRELGIGVDEGAVAAGARLDDAFNRLGRSTEGLKRNLVALVVDSGLVGWIETAALGAGTLASSMKNLNSEMERFGPAGAAFVGFLEGLSSGLLGGAIGQLDALTTGLGAVGRVLEAQRRVGDKSGDEALPAVFGQPSIPSAATPPEPSILERFAEDERLRILKEQDEAALKAAAAAEKVRAAWQDAAEKARVEWDKFFKSMEEAGRGTTSDMFKMASEDAQKSADSFTAGILEQVKALDELSVTFDEVHADAEAFLDTFSLMTKIEDGLGTQTTENLQSMGEQFAAMDQSIPGVAEALAMINAELEERGKKPIVSADELRRAEELINKLGEIAGIVGQLPALVEAFGVSAESSLGKAVGAFAEIGQSALGFAATLLDPSASIFAKIGAGVGAATSLIKGITSIFKTPSWKKVASDAGKIFGDELGESVSKELAEAIEKTAKDLGVSNAVASLLHIGDFMDESSQAATAFADEMSSLLQGIDDGSIPAKEGVEALGDAFSRLADEAEAGSVAAMASMGALAQQARSLGQSIPEIDAAVKAAVGESTGALGGLGGIKLVDEEDARAQAQIFLNVFNGVLATEGIVAAAQAIQPALKTFQEQLAGAGISKGAADAILGPIQSAMSLLKNDMTKGGAEGAQALKTILESQLKAGFLDANTFAAIQQQAGTAFDQMIAGGADVGAALQAVAPLLAQIQQTAAATGQAIDPVSQKLIDQAKAAGIAFPTDTGQQMVTLLGQVVTLLGGIPETFSQIGSATSSTFGTIQGEAMQTSSTILGAFDSVGANITSALAPVGDSLSQQLGGVFEAATVEAEQFAAFLSKLENTSLTIPFKFEGGGGFGGLGGIGTKIEGFAGGTNGKIRDFGTETLALLHGREAIFTEAQLKAGAVGGENIHYAPAITINGSGLNEQQLLSVIDRALKNNTQELMTRIRRGVQGKD